LEAGDIVFARDAFGSQNPEDDAVQMWCANGYALFTISGIPLIQPSPGRRIFLPVSRKTCKTCNSASLARQGQVNAQLILFYLSVTKPMLSRFKVPAPIPLGLPISVKGPSLDQVQAVNSIKHMIMD
jgi:hypothetical protein